MTDKRAIADENDGEDTTDSPTMTEGGIMPGGPEMAWNTAMPTPDIHATRKAAALLDEPEAADGD